MGIVGAEDVHGVFEDTCQFMREIDEEHVYRISDFTGAESTFEEVLHAMPTATDTGGTADPNVTVIFVGATAWVRVYKDAISNPFGFGKTIPMLNSIEEALHDIETSRASNGTA